MAESVTVKVSQLSCFCMSGVGCSVGAFIVKIVEWLEEIVNNNY